METHVWVTEDQTTALRISCLVKDILYNEKSPYQTVAVVDTVEFGRMLLLDSVIQTTEKDEFTYHEMMAHVALNTHPNPRTVLVVGGGDGGTVREVLKHPSVERVVLAEIDEKVVEASKRFMPTLSAGFSDPRVDIQIGDGIAHVRNHPNSYDVILVDSTDPVGAAVGLFSADFYRDVHRALTDQGILVAQSESPFFNADLIQKIYSGMKESFPLVRLYLSNVFAYPGALWAFTLGSKGPDPLEVKDPKPVEGTRYYSPQIHHSCFVLPPFVQELVTE